MFRILVLALGLFPLPAAAEPVVFQSADGIRLVADYRKPEGEKPVFILMHGLGAGRGEWRRFIKLLSKRGWGAFAFDARGHGESGGPGYPTFKTAAAWASIDADFDAAFAYLKNQGIREERIVPAGASLGANLAARAASRHPKAPFALLLSPGYMYAGIRLKEAVLANSKPLILAASLGDPYSLKSVRHIRTFLLHRESWTLEAISGHGVGMLEGKENESFVKELLKRLGERAALIPSSSVSPSKKQASP